jgi:pimeloyl-ACP methyl ester carboxylesterase
LFDEIRESNGADTKIIVTGHSLGGGIALEVSLKRENVDAYVFNTSPRFSADGYNIDNKRVSVVEHGEILKALRAPSREASQTYTSIGCSSGGPVSQHEQVKLAECLTQIAATQSPHALASLKLNKLKYLY